MNTYYNGQEAMIMQINISCNTVEKFREVENDSKKSYGCRDVTCDNIVCEDCIFEFIEYTIEDLKKEDRIK